MEDGHQSNDLGNIDAGETQQKIGKGENTAGIGKTQKAHVYQHQQDRHRPKIVKFPRDGKAYKDQNEAPGKPSDQPETGGRKDVGSGTPRSDPEKTLSDLFHPVVLNGYDGNHHKIQRQELGILKSLQKCYQNQRYDLQKRKQADATSS